MPSTHHTSHLRRLAGAVLSLALWSAAVIAAGSGASGQLTPEAWLASEVADAVNAERQARGLAPVSMTAFDAGFAQRIAEQRRDGCPSWGCHSTSTDRAVYDSPPYHIGEAVAHGGFSSGSVTRAWMQSSGHRSVVLLGNVDRMGVGIACRGDGAMAAVLVMVASSAEVATRPTHPAGTGSSPVVSGAGGHSCATAHSARGLDDGCPNRSVPEDGFLDVPPWSVHEFAIDCIVWRGLASGTGTGVFSPNRDVTRDQMASFVLRLLTEAGVRLDPGKDAFRDDDGNVHEDAINRLAGAGIVSGQTASRFGPDDPVTRAQMATFLDRSVTVIRGGRVMYRGGFFLDDDDIAHQGAIDRLAGVGIMTGTAAVTFDPQDAVTRAQMGSFLARTVDFLIAGGWI